MNLPLNRTSDALMHQYSFLTYDANDTRGHHQYSREGQAATATAREEQRVPVLLRAPGPSCPPATEHGFAMAQKVAVHDAPSAPQTE